MEEKDPVEQLIEQIDALTKTTNRTANLSKEVNESISKHSVQFGSVVQNELKKLLTDYTTAVESRNKNFLAKLDNNYNDKLKSLEQLLSRLNKQANSEYKLHGLTIKDWRSLSLIMTFAALIFMAMSLLK